MSRRARAVEVDATARCSTRSSRASGSRVRSRCVLMSLPSAVEARAASARRNAVVSASVPAVTRRWSRDADVADEDVALEQRLRSRRAGRRHRRTARSSTSSARPGSRARGSSTSRRSRCALMSSTMASISAACARAAIAAAWVSADRWYGSRTSRSASVDGGVGGEVAEPRAREGERLAHGAGDDEALPARRAASGRSARHAGVNSAYASSTTTMPCGGVVDRLDRLERQRRARRVVRRAEEHEVGVGLARPGAPPSPGEIS